MWNFISWNKLSNIDSQVAFLPLKHDSFLKQAHYLHDSHSHLGETVESGDLIAALRRITISRKGVVVMIGSSLKNKGVQPVLNSIVDFLPSPLEVLSMSVSEP